jgi:hypothetical protein
MTRAPQLSSRDAKLLALITTDVLDLWAELAESGGLGREEQRLLVLLARRSGGTARRIDARSPVRLGDLNANGQDPRGPGTEFLSERDIDRSAEEGTSTGREGS